MKYLLTIFAAAMLCLSASAQDHLCFEGIPIEGPVSSFVDKLKEAGFKEWEDDIARTLLKGKLFGRECTLIVKSNPDNGDVYAVTATFAIRNNWRQDRKVRASFPRGRRARTASSQYGTVQMDFDIQHALRPCDAAPCPRNCQQRAACSALGRQNQLGADVGKNGRVGIST